MTRRRSNTRMCSRFPVVSSVCLAAEDDNALIKTQSKTNGYDAIFFILTAYRQRRHIGCWTREAYPHKRSQMKNRKFFIVYKKLCRKDKNIYSQVPLTFFTWVYYITLFRWTSIDFTVIKFGESRSYIYIVDYCFGKVYMLECFDISFAYSENHSVYFRKPN